MQNTFGYYRTAAKLRQEDVAERLDVSQSTVSMWETGGSLPRVELLIRVAALYGCTVDELLGQAEAKDTA